MVIHGNVLDVGLNNTLFWWCLHTTCSMCEPEPADPEWEPSTDDLRCDWLKTSKKKRGIILWCLANAVTVKLSFTTPNRIRDLYQLQCLLYKCTWIEMAFDHSSFTCEVCRTGYCLCSEDKPSVLCTETIFLKADCSWPLAASFPLSLLSPLMISVKPTNDSFSPCYSTCSWWKWWPSHQSATYKK